MTQQARHRKPGKKGTAAIVAGCLVAAGGVGAVAYGLHGNSADTPDLAATTASTPPGQSGASSTSASSTSGSTSNSASASSAKPNSSHSSARSTKAPSPAEVVPNPTSHSTPQQVNPAGAACIPSHLTVSAVGIDEGVVAMGTNAQGQIYPPAHTTMWYDKSTEPGQNGIAVIAGHVEYDGPDNFYNLRNTPMGARVTVTCGNGKVVNLVVTGAQSIPKPQLTTDQRVWGGSSTPVVTLITCDINSAVVNGHHLNNYVVWTKPA